MTMVATRAGSFMIRASSTETVTVSACADAGPSVAAVNIVQAQRPQ